MKSQGHILILETNYNETDSIFEVGGRVRISKYEKMLLHSKLVLRSFCK